MRFVKEILFPGIISACLLTPAMAIDTGAKHPFRDGFNRHLDSLINDYQQDWKQSFESALARGLLSAHLDSLRNRFLEIIGPLPENTALNARITGTVRREGYAVEKILFESRPSYYVTALLFLPDDPRFTAPYPGILIPCGHAEVAKGHHEYQSMGALCALNGMAALVFDPIDQGERNQLIDEHGIPRNWGTRSHSLEGIKTTLMGKPLASYFIHDGMRAVDYMISRKEIDGERLGISGNSGGGTQTAYLFVTDERLKVSAPSCFIHNIFTQAVTEMGDAEQNVFGQIRDGIDHADYIMMRAPQPLKILAATHDFFRIHAVWETYRFAKRYYTSLGYSERMGILENNAGHNYNHEQREAAVQWMLRWLAGRDEIVREPEIELLSPEEYRVTPRGQVLLIPGAKSIHDLLREELARVAETRKTFLQQHSIDKVTLKIRSLTAIDELGWEGSLESTTESTHDGYLRTDILVRSGETYSFPAHLFNPLKAESGSPVIFLSEQGTDYHLGEILKMVEDGRRVFSLELPGTGSQKQLGKDALQLSSGLNWTDCNKAYLMGRSVVGYRVRDILLAARKFAEMDGKGLKLDLLAHGETGIPALHAAVLEPSTIASLKISGSIRSWEEVVMANTSFNQLVNQVHDVLPHYDLPDLVELLGDRVMVTASLNVNGFPVNGQKTKQKLSSKPEYTGLAGVFYKSPGLKNPEGPDWTQTLDMSWDNQVTKRGRDWSAEWFGYLKSPVDGLVTIYIATEQSVEMYIGGKLVANVGVKEGQAPETVKIEMKKGKFKPIRLVYTQDGSETSYLRLTWDWQGKRPHDIPLEAMWHSPAQRARMENLWRQIYE
jgi:dienelactone hydrolase